MNLTLSTTEPTRAGYIFLGWATSSTATTPIYKNGDVYSSNSSVTLYAVWEANYDPLWINRSTVVLGVGEKYTIKATGGVSNTWYSSNTTVAQVDQTGTITTITPGTASITISSLTGESLSCEVTVKPAPTSVKLNKTSVTLGIGETFDLNSIVNSGAASLKRTYTTTDSSVAVVKNTIITAKSAGTATITVKTFNGKTATCKVTVKPAPTSVKLNKTSVTLGIGETFDLNSIVNSGAASLKRTYTTTDSSVAVVKNTIITAKKTGTATITVKTFNGKKAICKVTVKK